MDRKELRLNQAVGIVVGVVGALMTANFWPSLRVGVGGWAGSVMWGMALGGLYGSLTQLHVVGKWVTRQDHKLLNFAIGLLLPFMMIWLLLFVLSAAGFGGS